MHVLLTLSIIIKEFEDHKRLHEIKHVLPYGL